MARNGAPQDIFPDAQTFKPERFFANGSLERLDSLVSSRRGWCDSSSRLAACSADDPRSSPWQKKDFKLLAFGGPPPALNYCSGMRFAHFQVGAGSAERTARSRSPAPPHLSCPSCPTPSPPPVHS